MILSKTDTYQLLYNSRKEKSIHIKYSYTTKYRWYCLHCLKTIYVSYKQYGRNSIFCGPCFITTMAVETIVQYQYMRVLKEKQMELIQSFTK